MGLEYGIISSVEKGRAKVNFPQHDIVSGWLPVLYPHTFKHKSFGNMAVNEQAVCLMDERLENGIVLGGIYSDADTQPDEANSNTIGIKYEDGAAFYYNTQSGKYISKVSNTTIEVSASGFKMSTATEDMKGLLEDIVKNQKDILTQLKSFSGLAGSVPVAMTPVQTALIVTMEAATEVIKTRVSNIFQ